MQALTTIRDPVVEIGGFVGATGRGSELVDDSGVESVLPILRALDVAVVAAPLAEEVAFETFPVRAPAAAALGNQRRAPSAT